MTPQVRFSISFICPSKRIFLNVESNTSVIIGYKDPEDLRAHAILILVQFYFSFVGLLHPSKLINLIPFELTRFSKRSVPFRRTRLKSC